MKIRKNEIEIITEYNERIVMRPARMHGCIAELSAAQQMRVRMLVGNYEVWDCHGERMSIEEYYQD